jgi:DNA-directed RNA polymerase subunit alpha
MNGVKEDVLHIVLNLKKLRVKVYSDEPVVVRLSKKGVGEVTAADITANADVEIINPELVLANITDEKGSLDMEITLSKGRGYSPTEDRENTTGEIGVIAIDAMFSPVRVVGLHVENTRVGDITNYDKLIMTVTTDGTITPQEAVAQATKILLNHFTWIQGQLDHASLTEQLNRKSESSDNE